MKIQHLLIPVCALTLSSCSTVPYAEEEKIELGTALTDALKGLNYASQYARDHGLNTFRLKPTKGTISLDLTTTRDSQNNATLAAALPKGANASFGWGASRSVQKGSHLVIEFTPVP